MDEADPNYVPPVTKAELHEVLERYRHLATRTKNPMYAWAGLSLIRTLANPAENSPNAETLSIPVWIADYLFRVAGHMQDLSAGVDIRKPESMTIPLDETNIKAFMHSVQQRFREDRQARKISKSDAMSLLPVALEFTRGSGWNAFASYQATSGKVAEHRTYQALKATGLSAKQALHSIAEAKGISDQSRLYARIREGRTLDGQEEVSEPGG